MLPPVISNDNDGCQLGS